MNDTPYRSLSRVVIFRRAAHALGTGTLWRSRMLAPTASRLALASIVLLIALPTKSQAQADPDTTTAPEGGF
jgi:hypothetical protein